MTSSEYKANLKQSLSQFREKGDVLELVNCFRRQDSTCELCGYHPITENFVLMNTRTRQTLRVGSNCIINYKRALAELDEADAKPIVYGPKMKAPAQKIIAKAKSRSVLAIKEPADGTREAKAASSAANSPSSDSAPAEQWDHRQMAEWLFGTDEETVGCEGVNLQDMIERASNEGCDVEDLFYGEVREDRYNEE